MIFGEKARKALIENKNSFFVKQAKEHSSEDYQEYRIEDYRQIFAAFDSDRDGRISVSQLGPVLRTAGRMPNEAALKQLQSALNSETFTFADFISIVPRLPVIGKGAVRVALTDAFRQFDEIGFRMVTTEEAIIVLSELGALMKAECAIELIGLVDPLGKGFVKYNALIEQLVIK